jgi:hypothetical protein
MSWCPFPKKPNEYMNNDQKKKTTSTSVELSRLKTLSLATNVHRSNKFSRDLTKTSADVMHETTLSKMHAPKVCYLNKTALS